LSKYKKVRVRCPKCGAKIEVDIPVIEAPGGQVLFYEVTDQASPEAVNIWEKRKKQLELE